MLLLELALYVAFLAATNDDDDDDNLQCIDDSRHLQLCSVRVHQSRSTARILAWC